MKELSRTLKRWNTEAGMYEDYEVPDDWHLSCYESKMDTKVNCCQCGKVMLFGDGYTSMEVHTKNGFGYCVCEKCYEMERRRNVRNNENQRNNTSAQTRF